VIEVFVVVGWGVIAGLPNHPLQEYFIVLMRFGSLGLVLCFVVVGVESRIWCCLFSG
jgi:hypothetical protein